MPTSKPAHRFALVLVTAPNLGTARGLVHAALKARLVACGSLVRSIESHYSWKGGVEQGNEVMIFFKTTRQRLRALEKLVLENHPYDTPEFLVLGISAGTKRYLDWLSASVRNVAV